MHHDTQCGLKLFVSGRRMQSPRVMHTLGFEHVTLDVVIIVVIVTAYTPAATRLISVS